MMPACKRPSVSPCPLSDVDTVVFLFKHGCCEEARKEVFTAVRKQPGVLLVDYVKASENPLVSRICMVRCSRGLFVGEPIWLCVQKELLTRNAVEVAYRHIPSETQKGTKHGGSAKSGHGSGASASASAKEAGHAP